MVFCFFINLNLLYKNTMPRNKRL